MSSPSDAESTPVPALLPYPWNCAAAEHAAINASDELLGVARCPICNHALVARQGRHGPYFQCGCALKKAG